MGRITPDMSLEDSILAMSDGNPGAIRVLAEGARLHQEIDPQNALGPWGLMANLDAAGIHAERIWILYKDLCGESVPKTAALARCVQMGILDSQTLSRALDSLEKIDVDLLAGRLREELPSFRC